VFFCIELLGRKMCHFVLFYFLFFSAYIGEIKIYFTAFGKPHCDYVSCAQNMELHTSSHPPIPNTLFLQTSSQDTLLSFSPSHPLAAPVMRPDSLPRL